MQNKQQLVDYLVSLDAKRRTPAMITDIINLADQGHGRKFIVAETGYGDKTVRKVLSAYRAWQVAQSGADAVEAVLSRDSGSVVDDDDRKKVVIDNTPVVEYVQPLNTHKHEVPEIEGVMPDTDFDAEQAWQIAFNAQDTAFAHAKKKQDQTIRFKHAVPIAIAWLSDTHIGGAGVDYRAMKRDAEIIRDTDGMYSIFHGDGTDNWIVGKLQGLQRGQALTFDTETQLFASWLEILKSKMVAVVSGNHDLWSFKVSGGDRLRECLSGTKMLYGRHEVVFDLHIGETVKRHKVRHKWRFNSVFNPTHGLEVGWDRGSDEYDVAVGGHTHVGTYFRPFDRHNKRRMAVLTGSYKRLDEFAEEIGFQKTQDNGCGAIIYMPDGRMFTCADLQTASEFLSYVRSKY